MLYILTACAHERGRREVTPHCRRWVQITRACAQSAQRDFHQSARPALPSPGGLHSTRAWVSLLDGTAQRYSECRRRDSWVSRLRPLSLAPTLGSPFAAAGACYARIHDDGAFSPPFIRSTRTSLSSPQHRSSNASPHLFTLFLPPPCSLPT